MRRILVDISLSGHHIPYMESIIQCCNPNEVILVVPQKVDQFKNIVKKQYVLELKKSVFDYFRWIRTLKKIIIEEKIELIHFLCIDDFFWKFGIGLGSLKHLAPIIVTSHRIPGRRTAPIIEYSLCRISKYCSATVFHTSRLTERAKRIGIKNAEHIEYPQFNNTQLVDVSIAREQLNIPQNDAKVLLALGETREEKGLDLLLEALQHVDAPFHLIIAGKESFFTLQYIENKIKLWENKVTVFLEYIDEKKMSLCLNASDIIILPYRKIFDGASGPLTEGVWCEKEIVGSNHGSLGKIITDNHLGVVFETENIGSLISVLENELKRSFSLDEKYLAYKESMKPERFQDEYKKLYVKAIEDRRTLKE